MRSEDQIIINLSGRAGQDGENGKNGQSIYGSQMNGSQMNGSHGKHGLHGENGGIANLNLTYTDSTKRFAHLNGIIDHNGKRENLNEVISLDKIRRIVVNVQGGHGGNGGSGGRGADGDAGSSGSWGCPANDGDRGEDGGDGGDGGNGGHGGNAGFVKIDIPSSWPELTMLFEINNSPGKAGKGGNSGMAGDGGSGGQGGTCSENGNTSYGSSGFSGDRGRSGRSGTDGNRGTQQVQSGFALSGATFTRQGLSLELINFAFTDENEDGLLEPGEKFFLTSLTLKNVSEFNLPKATGITLSPISTELYTVNLSSLLKLNEELSSGESKVWTFNKGDIAFTAAPQRSDKRFNLQFMLSIHAINTLKATQNMISVQEPLEINLSPTPSPADFKSSSFFFDDSIMLDLKIKNKTQKEMGPRSRPFLLRFQWINELLTADHVFVKRSEDRDFSALEQFQLDNLNIPANSTFTLPYSSW